MNALVYLTSPVPALNIEESSFVVLRERFPHIDLQFCLSREMFERQLPNAELLFIWNFEASQYAAAPLLKAVFTPAAGRDWVADDPLGRVPVYHGAFHGILMRESLLALILHFNACHDSFMQTQRRHAWDRSAGAQRSLLRSQTVLIIGFGAIGRCCAQVLRPFGCRVIGTQRAPVMSTDAASGVELVSFEQRLSWAARADHVVLLLPGGDTTAGIIDAAFLGAMKPTAYLYNLGRGTVVDEPALIAALRDKKIAGAGLDVFAQEPLSADSPLWDLDNVILTPHASACYREYGELFVTEAVERLVTIGV